jgi:DNA-binding transcriptional LysR family regulator
MVICGAPAYFEQHGVPETLGALAAHRCSAFRHPGTGKVVPWHVKLGEQTVDQPVVPAICSNDELFELQAVLAGKALGQLAGVTAAPYIRAGQLIPILIDHMPDIASYFVYFGSKTSQPVRARAFIDLAVQRLADNPDYVLSEEELRTKQGRRGRLVDKHATGRQTLR